MFERANGGGVAVGTGRPYLETRYVPVLAAVEVGERVLSSGQDGVYPPGFVVGTVEAVTGQGLDRQISIRPVVDFSHLEIVLVMLAKPPRPEEEPQ